MLTDKLALGTAQFGLDYGISNLSGQTPLSEVKEILNLARSKEIAFLDTASAYGESEKILGDIGVKKFKVISKFIATEKSQLDYQINTTLTKLNAKSIYGYLSHRPKQVFSNTSLWDKLNDYKELKTINKIGFSISTIEEFHKISELNLIPDLIQIPYNLFDQRFTDHIEKFRSLYGTEIHSRSTFLQGLFFMNYTKLKEPLGVFRDSLKSLNKVSEKYRLSISNLALNYVTSSPLIDKVLVGVQNKIQLNELLQVSRIENIGEIINEIKLVKTEHRELLNPSNWQK
jgi:aryl-alcohol dehydrogenase-like predicted oxidoreductase